MSLFSDAVEMLEGYEPESFILLMPTEKGIEFLFPAGSEEDFLALRDAAHQISMTFNPFKGVSGHNLVNGKPVDSTHKEKSDDAPYGRHPDGTPLTEEDAQEYADANWRFGGPKGL